jgi:hypothetical protein
MDFTGTPDTTVKDVDYKVGGGGLGDDYTHLTLSNPGFGPHLTAADHVALFEDYVEAVRSHLQTGAGGTVTTSRTLSGTAEQEDGQIEP